MSNTPNHEQDYKIHYSEESFWEKLRKHAGKAGKKVVYAALLGFYALQNPKVPMKAKATIYGALGYLILPIDLVPDFVPGVGYGDDLAALLYAVTAVTMYLSKEVKERAKLKLEEWFGPLGKEDQDIIEVEATVKEAKSGIDESAAT